MQLETILGLIARASPIVQLVMLVLVLCSLISWLLIFQRYLVIGRGIRELRRFERRFWRGGDILKLYKHYHERSGKLTGVSSVFYDGFTEYSRLSHKKTGPVAVMEGAQRRMRVAINREEEILEAGLGALASIGSVSPYIGLFGTVIGIMTSFLALAVSEQGASIQVVAPGIAEALIATAMGLFAAIPAVLAYNHFHDRVAFLLARYEQFADEFASILHRKLHGGSQ